LEHVGGIFMKGPRGYTPGYILFLCQAGLPYPPNLRVITTGRIDPALSEAEYTKVEAMQGK